MAPALALDAATGPVVLTVYGRVRKPNAGSAAQFDMAMLEQLPQHSFVTSTPWYLDAAQVQRPTAARRAGRRGADGQQPARRRPQRLPASTLPFDGPRSSFDVLLARLLDDKPMAVRDKGPLFIIYPFDSSAELRTTVYYSRSAWQLKSLEVQ